jgi:hypothetical protein|nr:MAG TPA: Transcription initiation factor IIE, alpha FINGER, Transcription [Bacteriophage sp.]
MVRIIEVENVITCPECDRNLSYEEDDVFFSKLDYLSDKHNTYYNRCIRCPWCKSEVVVADNAIFVKPTGTDDTPITSIEGKE